MTSFNFNEIGKQLQMACQKSESTGVSFAGKSLKLNSEEDGKYFQPQKTTREFFWERVFLLL